VPLLKDIVLVFFSSPFSPRPFFILYAVPKGWVGAIRPPPPMCRRSCVFGLWSFGQVTEPSSLPLNSPTFSPPTLTESPLFLSPLPLPAVPSLFSRTGYSLYFALSGLLNDEEATNVTVPVFRVRSHFPSFDVFI